MRKFSPLILTLSIFLLSIIISRYVSETKTKAKPKSSYKPTPKRSRDHFEKILLRTDHVTPSSDETTPTGRQILNKLRQIYHKKVKPVEDKFKYADLQQHVINDVDISARPIVLLVGPWSTGKTTIINYILGIDDKLERLYTGAQPTTSDFTVVSYGDHYRTIDGMVLATDRTKPFTALENFGQKFLQHLLGIEMRIPLLRNITFVDTPGILENRRRLDRGYPYNEVMRWLVQRADLILLTFDPTKLDVGYELEQLFRQLKGKESGLRILLNKADSVGESDLMKVYGALFWALSPLINVTEAPRIYVGSFWSDAYKSPTDLTKILFDEEKTLLRDMYNVIRNRLYAKIGFLRQYAVRVRMHAYFVDSYVNAYRSHKGTYFKDDHELIQHVIAEPDAYDVPRLFMSSRDHPELSEFDLSPTYKREYEEFFKISPLQDHATLTDVCGKYFSIGKCTIDELRSAVNEDLPNLLQFYRKTEAEQMKKSAQTCGDAATAATKDSTAAANLIAEDEDGLFCVMNNQMLIRPTFVASQRYKRRANAFSVPIDDQEWLTIKQKQQGGL